MFTYDFAQIDLCVLPPAASTPPGDPKLPRGCRRQLRPKKGDGGFGQSPLRLHGGGGAAARTRVGRVSSARRRVSGEGRAAA